MADKKEVREEVKQAPVSKATVETTASEANKDATAGALDSMRALKIDLQNRLDARRDETINGLTMEQIDEAIAELEAGLKSK